MRRLLLCLTGLILCFAAARLPAAEPWSVAVEGVLVSQGLPHGFAIVRGESAVLIGASRGMDLQALKQRGVKQIDFCLLTHHHRDTSALASKFAAEGIPVRAPMASAKWLSANGVQQYWATSLQDLVPGKKPGLRDRTFGDWSYLVHATAPAGVTCDLAEGETIDWQGLKIRAFATPGHSRDHMTFVVGPWCFCGDAFSTAGKLWSPYTTDWHHATDEGLVAAAKSLRALAELKPMVLFPEHGPAVVQNITESLNETAAAVDEAAFLKSYERFTKQRVKNAPEYAFLAKEQVATAGEKPWSRLSEHLFLTGNTYVLASRDGPILIIDPYNVVIGQQIQKLQQEQKLGPIETVLISHAHNDHYLGLYELPALPAEKRFQVWTLDKVAEVIGEPYRYYAPYLDIRGVQVDRALKHGETVKWHEYTFHFQHAPGQTYFTMGFEVEIDGKRCYHTADNFFHADQFEGSGGWAGRNRGWPDAYAASARDVLKVNPDWILAEHGGPYVYSAEDYRRRVAWGEATTKAADALSNFGTHRIDWNPTYVRVQPLVVRAVPGEELTINVLCDGEARHAGELTVELDDPSLLSAPARSILRVEPGKPTQLTIKLSLSPALTRDRHVLPLRIRGGEVELPADVFVVLEARKQGLGW